jgi:hypothetical protein
MHAHSEQVLCGVGCFPAACTYLRVYPCAGLRERVVALPRECYCLYGGMLPLSPHASSRWHSCAVFLLSSASGGGLQGGMFRVHCCGVAAVLKQGLKCADLLSQVADAAGLDILPGWCS